MIHAARAVIDLGALRHNLARARQAAPGARVMAVIKAEGYGHGMLRAARALDGADAFAVGRMSEALALREAGIAKPVVLLEGVFDAEELALAVRHGFQCVVHAFEQLELLEGAAPGVAVTAWLKIDTGMGRLGFSVGEGAEAYRRLRAAAAVGELHFMTHFARADERDAPYAEEQLARFHAVLHALGDPPGERSVVNSAGLLGAPAAAADWVRPGLMLYGASPFVGGRAEADDLRPAMTLTAPLIAVRRMAAGDSIGYGGGCRCPEAMPVGVVAVGYGDGYPRHAAPGTPVLVNGVRVPLMGRVSMDMITLDLRAAPDARPGDWVTLWGDGLPVEEVAERAATIPYQLLCNLTRRVVFEERE